MQFIKAMPHEATCYFHHHLRLQLHGAIYRPDSFVLLLSYCANLKAIRYESTSLKRIVADKSHRVIVAYHHWVMSHLLNSQKVRIENDYACCLIEKSALHDKALILNL